MSGIGLQIPQKRSIAVTSLGRLTGPTEMKELDSKIDDLLVEWEQQRRNGSTADPAELCREYPELLDELRRRIEVLKATDWLFEPDDKSLYPHENRDSAMLGQLGEYEILGFLGAGGMGTVYAARHRKLDKRVALKILPERRLWDRQAVARFEREMRAVGKLEHPHLVTAYDAGEIDGTHYLAMQLVEGCDTAQLATRIGPLRSADACEIARQAALGLHAAHSQQLVHRDVKPSNLMLSPDGIVKVLDLGLARLTTDVAEPVQISTSGKVMGTLDYMAPEQCDDCHAVDLRADIYGLGATLYKLLCGKAPLEGDRPATTLQKLRTLANGRIPSLRVHRPDLPAALIQYVDTMLSKEPADRPGSAAEVADRMSEFAMSSDLRTLASQVNSATERSMSTVSGYGRTITEDATGKITARQASVDSTVSAYVQKKRSNIRFPLRIALGLLSVAVLLALAEIVIQMDKGTLTITGDGVTVEQLKEAGVRLIQKSTQQTYDLKIGSDRLRTGAYVIEVSQQPSGLEFSATEFTIARGTPQEVTVTFKPTVTREVLVERWEFIQKLQTAGVMIDVDLPDGSKRKIQSPSEIPSIRSVIFHGPNGTEENVCRLLEFTSLKELTLLAVGSMSKPAIEAVGKQTGLTQLRFDSSPIGDDGLLLLKDLKQIRDLMLWACNLTDAGLVHLQHFPQLETAELGANRGITGSGLAALQPLSRLRFVSVHNCALTDENLRQLKHLPQVTQWAIGGGSEWTNSGLKELAGPNHIQELLVDKSELSDEGLTHLATLPNLKLLRTRQSKVTADGLAAFLAARPECKLEADPGTLPTAPDANLNQLTTQITDPIIHSLVGLSSEWTWTEPKMLTNGVNAGGDEQQPHLSGDGLRLWFQSGRGEKPGHELYFTQRASIDDAFRVPELLPAPFNVADETCPSLTADELDMVFVSDRAGTVGHYDLFLTHRTSTEKPWDEPVNLGPHINTQAMDLSPAISGDGLILIFSTNGRAGHGLQEHGTELFECRRESRDAPFGNPVNLGATVNSWTADSGGWLSSDARMLVFRSSRGRPALESQLYLTTRPTVDQPFHKPLPLVTPFNSQTRESGFAMNADLSIAIIATHRPGGSGGCDLWITQRVASGEVDSVKDVDSVKQQP